MRKWTVAAAVIALTVGLAGPAHADNEGKFSTQFVDGAGVVTDDFGDHFKEIGGSLCAGCAHSWNTDTVVLWQSILAAEGLLSTNAIDGKFGAQTAEATKSWQRRYGLAADGKVGPATWGRADYNLYFTSKGRFTKYIGRSGNVTFRRGGLSTDYGDGAYMMEYVDGADGSASFDGSRIYHKKRTITVR
ncbi:peptidoglycan-binding domain-containing protein [Haloactinopolyspora sp.]|uniref:peptidoglycan-binding domain-containing protein n=1 Tax=Haloactinopolyspora sp. TaxID=1966353 RepID=UPI002619FE9A|nr:peptidoglycan-binding domain-containing protein [Haloactinopolyspora sp.]